jgi:hypothetical protein
LSPSPSSAAEIGNNSPVSSASLDSKEEGYEEEVNFHDSLDSVDNNT